MSEIGSKISNILEYRERIKALRNKRVVMVLAGTLLIFAVAFGINLFIRYRVYSGYKTVYSRTGEDNSSADYTKLGKCILRYGLGGARLEDQNGKELWSQAFSMRKPQLEMAFDTAAIYEKGGNQIRTFNKTGQLGNMTTPMPIRKAKAASQGVAAAILEDDSHTWIKYYHTDGSEIASFRTEIDTPGYPMDIALSEDGMRMAVAYVYFENGQTNSQVAFYDFGKTGEEKQDHLLKAVSYKNCLIPQIDYVDKDTCIAYTDKGFLVFRGTASEKENYRVEEEKPILSLAHDGEYVAMIENSGDAVKPYILKAFDLTGRRVMEKAISFSCDKLSIDDGRLLLWNQGEFAVFNFHGVQKYRGSLEEGAIKRLLSLGNENYMAVTEQGTVAFELK